MKRNIPFTLAHQPRTASSGDITLSPDESRRFLDALNAPFQPNARLKRAMDAAARVEQAQVADLRVR